LNHHPTIGRNPLSVGGGYGPFSRERLETRKAEAYGYLWWV
jgi:hypothetical protein